MSDKTFCKSFFNYKFRIFLEYRKKNFLKIFDFSIDIKLTVNYIIVNPDFWRWMAISPSGPKGPFLFVFRNFSVFSRFIINIHGRRNALILERRECAL